MLALPLVTGPVLRAHSLDVDCGGHGYSSPKGYPMGSWTDVNKERFKTCRRKNPSIRQAVCDMLMAHACAKMRLSSCQRDQTLARAAASHWRLPDLNLHMLLQVKCGVRIRETQL